MAQGIKHRVEVVGVPEAGMVCASKVEAMGMARVFAKGGSHVKVVHYQSGQVVKEFNRPVEA